MRFIDKKFITKDYTGKYVPFTREFIDSIFDESVRWNDRPHMMYRLEHDLYKVRDWGNSIGYDINDKVRKALAEGYVRAFIDAVETNKKYGYMDMGDFSLTDAVYFLAMLDEPPTLESAKLMLEWIEEEKKYEEQEEKQEIENAEKKCKEYLQNTEKSTSHK